MLLFLSLLGFPGNSNNFMCDDCFQPNSEVHIHWKGAAEIVLAQCTSFLGADGIVQQMDEDKAKHFRKAIEDVAASSLRCVAIAYRLFDLNKVPKDEDQLAQWDLPDDDLVLLAIVGIKTSMWIACRRGNG
ncbi:P-type Ca(2+) transporter [Ranunculus cassubicifolius]